MPKSRGREVRKLDERWCFESLRLRKLLGPAAGAGVDRNVEARVSLLLPLDGRRETCAGPEYEELRKCPGWPGGLAARWARCSLSSAGVGSGGTASSLEDESWANTRTFLRRALVASSSAGCGESGLDRSIVKPLMVGWEME